MSALIYLDRSGKTRAVKVPGWKNKIWDGSRGYYGYWCMFNIEPIWRTTTITDVPLYAGNGQSWSWHIKWDADTV
jgi:hypothetical protein